MHLDLPPIFWYLRKTKLAHGERISKKRGRGERSDKEI
jgi:hypothetical protein